MQFAQNAFDAGRAHVLSHVLPQFKTNFKAATGPVSRRTSRWAISVISRQSFFLHFRSSSCFIFRKVCL